MYVEKPKTISELVEAIRPERIGELVQFAEIAAPGGYLHWEDIRHREPPEGLTLDEWWFSIKLKRNSSQRRLPLHSTSDEVGVVVQTDEIARLLHAIDQRCSGMIAMPEQVLGNDQARRHFLISSLMEEAIRSSQIEGAATTRKVAKDMLRTGREPRSQGERMITNNYAAMRFIDSIVGAPLTKAHILELQRVLTVGTLEDPIDAGRFQTAEDDRVIVGEQDGSVLHTPPPAEALEQRMSQLCEFANEQNARDRFVHPVIRAIVLHFWLAYDHPFADGNGRTARALFYWKMRSEGYWLVEYLSISEIIRKSIRKYVRAFLYTETDEFDLTYFVDHQLHVIDRALAEFTGHLERKVENVQRVERLIRDRDLNYRQRALLGSAIRDPQKTFTFRSHATSHDVVHETARRDLLDLENRGLLVRRKGGRERSYIASPNLSQLLEND